MEFHRVRTWQMEHNEHCQATADHFFPRASLVLKTAAAFRLTEFSLICPFFTFVFPLPLSLLVFFHYLILFFKINLLKENDVNPEPFWYYSQNANFLHEQMSRSMRKGILLKSFSTILCTGQMKWTRCYKLVVEAMASLWTAMSQSIQATF